MTRALWPSTFGMIALASMNLLNITQWQSVRDVVRDFDSVILGENDHG